MKPPRILLRPDGDDGGDGTKDGTKPDAPASKPAAPKGDTSADIVKKGKSAEQVKLEKRNAELEDELGSLKTRNGELEKLFTDTKKIPSAKGGGKSVHDEISEFFGWGQK